MYLVHVELALADGSAPAPDLGRRVLACALSGDRVEHVSAHVVDAWTVVLGFFVIAGSVHVAEASAARVCRRALSRLDGMRMAPPRAAFVPPAVLRRSC